VDVGEVAVDLIAERAEVGGQRGLDVGLGEPEIGDRARLAEAERAQRGEAGGADDRGDPARARRGVVSLVGGVRAAHALAGVDLKVAEHARVVGVGGQRRDGDGVTEREHLGRAVEVVVEIKRAGVLAAAQLLEALAHGGGDARGDLARAGLLLAHEAGVLTQRGAEPADGEQHGRQGDAEAEREQASGARGAPPCAHASGASKR